MLYSFGDFMWPSSFCLVLFVDENNIYIQWRFTNVKFAVFFNEHKMSTSLLVLVNPGVPHYFYTFIISQSVPSLLSEVMFKLANYYKVKH